MIIGEGSIVSGSIGSGRGSGSGTGVGYYLCLKKLKRQHKSPNRPKSPKSPGHHLQHPSSDLLYLLMIIGAAEGGHGWLGLSITITFVLPCF